MLKAALAFVPLLAGYLFVSTWHETRYLIKREDSQKLYIRAAFWGIWLFLLALALTVCANPYLESLLAFLRAGVGQAGLLEEKGGKVDTAFWVLVLAATLVLGLIGGYVLNWFLAFKSISTKELFRLAVRRIKSRDARLFSLIYEYSNRAALKRAIHLLNSDLDLILMRALEQSMPICVTLGHGKVYVGYVTGAIDPGDKRDMLRILPFVSGYRASDGLKMHFTTWYTTVYQRFTKDETLSHLNPELFEVVFPLSEVKSVNLFDIRAYQAFQEDKPSTTPD
ncbi:hypothetical protein [Pseudomonas jinjuensis]|uniref:Uncharacterized protein n=1 Tax=Pseudomonas jinjuensis TaxID=198616 RepID=A0A1H0GJM7_9PSED|nr:hypothetical protein [Pseudomonas jinjuensis]SDO07054.1 hypothetical protein SAMN05216193_107215 [Pseudomonas jinjuensis]